MQTWAHNLLSKVYKLDRMEQRSRLDDHVCASHVTSRRSSTSPPI